MVCHKQLILMRCERIIFYQIIDLKMLCMAFSIVSHMHCEIISSQSCCIIIMARNKRKKSQFLVVAVALISINNELRLFDACSSATFFLSLSLIFLLLLLLLSLMRNASRSYRFVHFAQFRFHCTYSARTHTHESLHTTLFNISHVYVGKYLTGRRSLSGLNHCQNISLPCIEFIMWPVSKLTWIVCAVLCWAMCAFT